MSNLRAFATVSTIGLFVGLVLAIWTPISEGHFEGNFHGVVAAFGVIKWSSVFLVSGIFAAGWVVYKIGALQSIWDFCDGLELLAGIWRLLTCWWH